MFSNLEMKEMRRGRWINWPRVADYFNHAPKLFTPPCIYSHVLPINAGMALTHVIALGQWNDSKCGANRGLVSACPLWLPYFSWWGWFGYPVKNLGWPPGGPAEDSDMGMRSSYTNQPQQASQRGRTSQTTQHHEPGIDGYFKTLCFGVIC